MEAGRGAGRIGVEVQRMRTDRNAAAWRDVGRVVAGVGLVLACLWPGAGVLRGEEPAKAAAAFDGSRMALTIPEEAWQRVLADGGRAGGRLGYTPDELRPFGKDAHLLRNVQALFADVRTIPRESGRISTGFLDNAAKPSEVLARAWAQCDVSAGRMYAAPKAAEGKAWGLPEIDALAQPGEALAALLVEADPQVAALPPAVQRLLVRVLVGQSLAEPWVALARRELGTPWPREAAAAHARLMAPWTDEANDQTATLEPVGLDLVGRFDRARLAYAGQVLAVHLERALEEWRAAPEADRQGSGPAQPLRLSTRLGGVLLLCGAGNDRVGVEAGEGVRLSLDLGGDDAWEGALGTAGPVGPGSSVHLDLGGNDRYAAPQGAALGAGVGGVGVLVDVAGDDAYDAGSGSLGRGLLGAGLLMDLAGNDRYRTRGSWGQGAGHVGVGALVDLAGDDEYECDQQSQGLGGTLGTGLLLDLAGNDAYVARDDGNISALYLGQSVAMSQGCGYGRRADLGDGWSLAGGVGLLLDGAGDDRYHAQVWAQGCGYWWGLGILEDRGGDDTYQNGKYSAGAAAHFAIGACIDLAGNDTHNATNLAAKNQFQGHARDGSIGVFVDGDGDDGYDVNHNCAGSADLNSIALFWDRRGNDRYTFHPATLEGPPNGWNDTGAFGTCTRYAPFHSFRDDLPSWGVFLDTGGKDTYANERPAVGFTATPAADGATWRPQPGPHTYGLGYDLELFAR